MKNLRWLGLADARRRFRSGSASFCGFGSVGPYSLALLRVAGVEGVCAAVVGVRGRPVPGVSPAAVAFVLSRAEVDPLC
jgi:hypothetical protein